jgi:hypothetical protein
MALRKPPQGARLRQERTHWIIDPARKRLELAATLLGIVTIIGLPASTISRVARCSAAGAAGATL